MRDITPATQAAAAAQTGSFGHFIQFQFATGSQYLTTFGGNTSWSGSTWIAVGGNLSLGDVQESTDKTTPTVELQLDGVNPSMLNLVLNDYYIGRLVKVWRAYVNTNGTLVADPVLVFQGYMNHPWIYAEQHNVLGPQTSTLKTKCSSRLVVGTFTKGLISNMSIHQRYFPGDTFYRLLPKLSERSHTWAGNTIAIGGPTGIQTAAEVADFGISVAVAATAINPLIGGAIIAGIGLLDAIFGGGDSKPKPPLIDAARMAVTNPVSRDRNLPVVYGTCEIVPGAVFAATGSDPLELDLLYDICHGPVDKIGRVRFGTPDNSIIRMEDGTLGYHKEHRLGSSLGFDLDQLVYEAITPFFVQEFYTALGTDTQTAWNTIANNYPSLWDSTAQGNGIAQFGVRLKNNANLLPWKFGVAPVVCAVRGQKVFDPRIHNDPGTKSFSNNPALCALDYIMNTRFGWGISLSEIDTGSFVSAANHCDESVSVPTYTPWSGNGLLQYVVRKAVGGTLATASLQNRYSCDGVLDTGKTLQGNLNDLLTSCNGIITGKAGKVFMYIPKSRNTITNPSAETDLTDWGFNNATGSQDFTFAYDGNYSVKVTTANVGNDGPFVRNNGNTYPVQSGSLYRANFWIYGSGSAIGSKWNVQLENRDVTGGFIAGMANLITLAAGWNQYTVSGVMPSPVVATTPLVYTNGQQGVITAWFDNVEFYKENGLSITPQNTVGSSQTTFAGTEKVMNEVQVTFLESASINDNGTSSVSYLGNTLMVPTGSVPNPYLATDNSYPLRGKFYLPFTTDAHGAERLATIALKRSRRKIVIQRLCNEELLPAQAGDIIPVTDPTFGWVNKPFEVVSVELHPDMTIGLALVDYDCTDFNLVPSNKAPADNLNVRRPYINRTDGLPILSSVDVSGSYTIDATSGFTRQFRLTSNTVSFTMQNAVDGARYRMWLQQDEVGSRVWPSFPSNALMFINDTKPVLSTAPGVMDLFELEYRAQPTARFTCVPLQQNVFVPTPQVQSITNSQSTASFSHSVSMPAAVNAGDLLFVIAGLNGTLPFFNGTPVGWTGSYQEQGWQAGLQAYTKIASGNEGGTTVSLNSNFATTVAAQVYRITNASGIVCGSVANGYGANPNPPQLFPLLPPDRYLYIVSVEGAAVTAAPTNYTNLTTNSGGGAVLSTARRSFYGTTDDPSPFISSICSASLITFAILPPR